MADATLDVMKCESCSTPMLTYYTTDNLILYICPNCIDWTASEKQSKQNLFFVN